jgi:outer membrane protein TolC
MNWKRAISARSWLAGSLATIVALGLLSGCQPVFMSEKVYQDAHSTGNQLPSRFEDDRPVTAPLSCQIAAPATVSLPKRRPRNITLQEVIAISLENGSPSANSPEGTFSTVLAGFQGGNGSLNNQTDRIRVLALNPAIYSAAIEGNLARFDAVWVSSMNWTTTDNLLQGFAAFSNGQAAVMNSSIVKAFADGSVANISFITNYTNLNNLTPGSGFLNPLYEPILSFGYEVPLWQNSGVEINQLLSRIAPITGGSLTSTSAATGYNNYQGQLGTLGPSFAGAGNFEGILISKLRFDQSRTEFERNVHYLVKNVEIAYWTLYNKYGQLYSFEENLRILQRGYQDSYNNFIVGRLDPYKFLQIKGQFEEFRGNRIQAMQEVLDAERNLRAIIYLPMEDGDRLIPITPPTLAELRPDWDQSLKEALNLRPELILARDNVRYHQYLLTIQKNNLKPDLRFIAKFEPNGTGTTLTGNGNFLDSTGTPRPVNAFESLASLHYIDYTVGLFMNVPLGYRAEYAAIRAAKMQLAQSYYFLRDQEERATVALTEQYQEVNRWWKQLEANRAERLAYLESLKKYDQKVKGGKATYGDLEFLTLQRSYSAALVKEYNSISEYNNSLARLEFTKGTTLRYSNIHISEGALPECAQVRATEFLKDRTRAISLIQRPDALKQPAQMVVTKEKDLLAPDALPPVKLEPNPDGWQAPPPTPERMPDMGASPLTPGPVETRWTPPAGAPAQPAALDPLPKVIDAPNPLPGLQQTSSNQGAGTVGYISMEDFPAAPFVGGPASSPQFRPQH